MQARHLTLLLPLALLCIFPTARAMLTHEQHRQLELFEQQLIQQNFEDGPVQDFLSQLSLRVQETLNDTAQALALQKRLPIEHIISLYVEDLIELLQLSEEDGQTCRLLARESFEKSLASRKMQNIHISQLVMKVLVVIVIFYLLFVPAKGCLCCARAHSPTDL
ncbi:MAG: hypothetical protein WCW33_01925 [Candidatus Babeliales bacterium]|jgi:hypothetical protein